MEFCIAKKTSYKTIISLFFFSASYFNGREKYISLISEQSEVHASVSVSLSVMHSITLYNYIQSMPPGFPSVKLHGFMAQKDMIK